MRAFINLFLTILLPVSILFIIIAIFYFLTNYDLTKAIRLGTVSGMLTALGFSFILAIIVFIVRSLRLFRRENTTETIQENSIVDSPTLHTAIDKKVMLLMDKELAFEVSVYAILDQNIGDIVNGDKSKGSIAVRTPEESISISVSSLTKHTSQVMIKANFYSSHIKQIIHYLKLQEHSFIQY
jgi:hypothetical protein